MAQLDQTRLLDFINENINTFHEKRLRKIQGIKLHEVLRRKNPYLFRAKNIDTARELVTGLLEATLSSSEEGLFGGFLEALAIYVNQQVYGGQKSSSPGIDLDFVRDGTRYLVAIKSGPNWGNSSQYQALRENFKKALRILRQSSQSLPARTVLGICYGSAAPVDNGEYWRLEGQAFWEFISGSSSLYLDLIEPLGTAAQQHYEAFVAEKERTLERLITEFAEQFSGINGQIDWDKLVRYNSGNLS
ncbi:MAG: cytosolic protein [Anaerolineae bacterium]|nr:cytosolic protein [Anaerolineae bacterium]